MFRLHIIQENFNYTHIEQIIKCSPLIFTVLLFKTQEIKKSINYICMLVIQMYKFIGKM